MTELRIDWLIEEVEKIRDRDVMLQHQLKVNEENSKQFFYFEGRIGALSDVLLNYYFKKGR